jgi:chromosome segregation ATPase
MRTSSPLVIVRLIMTLGVAAATASGAARADASTEARLRDALRATTAQLHALEEEQARWQAAEAALKGRVESLEVQLAAARRAPAKPRDCGDAERRAAETTRRVGEQEEALQKLGQSLAQCQSAAQDSTRERAAALAQTKDTKGRLDAAEAKNARLYRIGKEIIDWLSSIGPVSAIAASEPFLGLKRVEIENAAQDYEDKLMEQRVKP